MFKPKERLSTLLVATIMGVLLMAPVFSYANDGSDTSQDRSGDAKATGHLISSHGEATADAPAEGRMRDERDWGLYFYEIPLKLKLDYEGVASDVQYKLDVKAYNVETGDQIEDYNMTVNLSPGSGTSTIECDVMGPLMPGDYRFKFKLYVEGDESKDIAVEPEGDMSFILRVTGVTESKILIDGDSTIDRSLYNILTMDRVEEGCQLTHVLKVEGLEPDTQYDLTGDFVKVDLKSTFTNNITSLKSFTGSGTTDADGNLTFVTDLPVNDMLEEGKVYSVRYLVKNPKVSSDSCRFWPFGADKDFVRIFSLDNSYLLTIKKQDPPETKKTQVDVNISNFIKGTDTMLKGAELKLVKGNDPDGEVIDSWTVGDEPHSIRLEVGDYTVVQTKVPSGYKLADPVHFTVEDRGGSVSGSNFIAYSINSDWKTNSADGFYIKEETTHDGTTAFCVNYGMNNPSMIDFDTASLLYYKELKLEDEDSFAKLKNPRYDKEKTVEALKGVIYAGHPDDGIGIKDRYSLSGNQFEGVTQAAVHYYTDSIQYELGPSSSIFNFSGNRDMYDAYCELISGNLSYPKGMTVKLYVPTVDGYQSLIATRFAEEGTEMAVSIFNEKPPGVKDETNDGSKGKGKKAEDGKKDSKGTDTGDHIPIGLWVALIVMICTAFAIGIILRRRGPAQR